MAQVQVFSGRKLRAARKAKHLSRERLAHLINLSVTGATITHYENGKYTPQFDTLLALARVLGVSVLDLTEMGDAKS